MSAATWTVVGDTPWGLAVAMRLQRGGHEVTVVREPDSRRPARKMRTLEPAEALAESERVVVGAPAGELEPLLTWVAPHLQGNHRLLLVAGALTPAARLPSEAAQSLTAARQIAVAAGAADADALGADRPAALVVGSAFPSWAREVQSALASHTLRVYTQADPVGVELAAAFAEAAAVALGAARGLGAGPVTEATALTRAVAEAERVVTALGGRAGTAYGLAGLGVLAQATLQAAGGGFAVGLALAAGEASKDAARRDAVDALCVRLGRASVEAPMLRMVQALLRDEVRAQDALERLMSRAQRAE